MNTHMYKKLSFANTDEYENRYKVAVLNAQILCHRITVEGKFREQQFSYRRT